jgi:hypothetical protein
MSCYKREFDRRVFEVPGSTHVVQKKYRYVIQVYRVTAVLLLHPASYKSHAKIYS